ncbi:MAG: SIS domain-containing protein [Anaerorhabdus sp.]
MNSNMILNETIEFLEEKKGIFTAAEIYNQPASWIRTTELLKNRDKKIDDLMNSYINDKDAKIIFMGAGTSEFVGRALASEVKNLVKCTVCVCGTTDMIVAPENYIDKFQKTLIISFGRSGNSPESIGAVESSDAYSKNTQHLLVTCNANGAMAKRSEIYQNCFELVLLEETHDKSFAMTSSFTNMFLVTLLCFDLANLERNTKELIKVSESVVKFFEKYVDSIKEEISKFNFNRIVYLGAESLKGIAQEASLKMLELSAGSVVTMFDTPLGFRHGPKSIVDDHTLTVIFLSDNEYRRLYEVDLIKEMSKQRKGDKILVVANNKCKEVENLVDYMIEFNTDLLQQSFIGLQDICTAQVIALFKSLALGVTPDNPCPTGEVNRVVKGVVVYPYKEERK